MEEEEEEEEHASSCTKEALYENIFVDLEPETTAQAPGGGGGGGQHLFKVIGNERDGAVLESGSPAPSKSPTASPLVSVITTEIGTRRESKEV